MKRYLILALLALSSALAALAADPTATHYTWDECQGSLRPYVAPASRVAYPDSLVPVFINHVGRHGARFPASAAHTTKLHRALLRADSLGTITPVGRRLLAITDHVIAVSANRWGALDSLGEAEQRGIASRMMADFAPVFEGGAIVNALSSYSPRAMMSMYAFTHQMDRLNNRLEFVTTTGRQNSPMMRPFDIDTYYIDLRQSDKLAEPYDAYFSANCPEGPAERALGRSYPFADKHERQELSLLEYYVLAGLQAISLQCDAGAFFTPAEMNSLWSCFNLRQYLNYSFSTVSATPAEIAAPLLQSLIDTTQGAIDETNPAAVCLHFGHAETLMPLLALMRLQGCYYLTNYFDTVGLHWRDFSVVPMAANLQLILFRCPASGRYYLRVDLNEHPIPLLPNTSGASNASTGSDAPLYTPWPDARAYLIRCLPLHLAL